MGIHLTGPAVINGVNLSAYRLTAVANDGSTLFNNIGIQRPVVGIHYVIISMGRMVTAAFN
jgi:hypothetical protein